MARSGIGIDWHAFAPGRRLILGGVEIPHEQGLQGHSDADVLAHAITDALLGAAGLGDIGQHFPDTDAAFHGADSIELLRQVATDVRDDGWAVGNADCSVICEHPRLAPMRDEMQRRLSDAVGAPVTVKGRRPEGLGALGRDEGIAVFAVAVLVRSSA
jgi:2-C-methyl-D-erythritol 2,4-cyclodiphosphate synthase